MRKHKKITSDDPKSSQEARARRVKSLRQMTRLSRRIFAEKFGIPASTLQNWEDIGANGLSEKGAIKLARILKSSGIHCGVEWLMHGVGASPVISEQLYMETPLSKQQIIPNDEEEINLIVSELLLFRSHYQQQVMDMVIPDDGMLPRFEYGEYVAGIRHYKDFDALLGIDCIVQVETGEMVVRQIRLGDIPDRYTLVCINPHTSVSKPIEYNVKILTAAPIIWSRRKVTARS